MYFNSKYKHRTNITLDNKENQNKQKTKILFFERFYWVAFRFFIQKYFFQLANKFSMAPKKYKKSMSAIFSVFFTYANAIIVLIKFTWMYF